MPYIKKSLRKLLDESSLNRIAPKTPGELTYVLSKVLTSYVAQRPAVNGAFATFAELMGALECAKAEYYRRVVAPYEDQKCLENGDVYV